MSKAEWIDLLQLSLILGLWLLNVLQGKQIELLRELSEIHKCMAQNHADKIVAEVSARVAELESE
jgi:hypothetical protein